MKWYKSKVKWLLIIVYVIIVLVTYSFVFQSERSKSNEGFPSGFGISLPKTRNIETMKAIIFPWGYMLSDYNEESFRVKTVLDYENHGLPRAHILITRNFLLSILANIFILYFIGYGIEKLIKKRNPQPPNQGQPPKE